MKFHFNYPLKNKANSKLVCVDAKDERQARKRACFESGMGRCSNGTKLKRLDLSIHFK
jgi:hypothetical protein